MRRGQLLAIEHLGLAGLDIGGGDEELDVVAGPDAGEIDVLGQEILKRMMFSGLVS